jgi:hypothetical protein
MFDVIYILSFSIPVFGLLVLIYVLFKIDQSEHGKSRVKVEQAELRIKEHPEKVRPVWDLARVNLESYFSDNQRHVRQIFYLSVSVMFIGFAIIVGGAILAFRTPNLSTTAIITGIAGVITELIGATFLVIYKSTMQQAISFIKVLERINSVGMAVQIIDTMPDEEKSEGLKNNTKAKLVTMLMEGSNLLVQEKNED